MESRGFSISAEAPPLIRKSTRLASLQDARVERIVSAARLDSWVGNGWPPTKYLRFGFDDSAGTLETTIPSIFRDSIWAELNISKTLSDMGIAALPMAMITIRSNCPVA